MSNETVYAAIGKAEISQQGDVDATNSESASRIHRENRFNDIFLEQTNLSNKIDVLLIEDDLDDAYITKNHLKRTGSDTKINIDHVSNVDEAAVALRGHFDVCLLDINLGSCTGFDLIEQVGEQAINGPVILLTGDAEGGTDVAAGPDIVRDYICKGEATGTALLRSMRYAIRDYRAMRRLHFLANNDALTGLFRRQYFDDELVLRLSNASATAFSVFYIDLDGFKLINDQHGHDIGDAVLKETAVRLRACFDASEVVARYGGDEFVAISNIADREFVAKRGRKMLDALRLPISTRKGDFVCSGSIGAAIADTSDLSVHELMRRSDEAMYLSKCAGRDTMRLFDGNQINIEPLPQPSGEAFRKAIQNGSLTLSYQPIYRVENSEVIGAEALLRFSDPIEGLVPVSQLLLMAEGMSLICELDRAVLHVAVKDISSLCEQNTIPDNFLVTVNIEPATLIDSEFVHFVKSLTHDYPEIIGRLGLEVIERALLPNNREILTTLQQVKSLGIRVLIDDFGAGQSALSYLADLPICGIKLDRSFIVNVVEKTRSKLLVEGVIGMAKTLELVVVCEGIETNEQMGQIKKSAGEFAQGYYLSKPLSLAQLMEFTSEKSQ